MSISVAALLSRLPRSRRRVLRAAAQVARSLRLPVYLIGGSVRDLLLRRGSPDLDLCVVGDGIAFARELAAALDAPWSEDRRFLTAKIEARDGAIDVATARRETYSHPGALPRVVPASIEDDLARRDFTVNAMAVPLHPLGRRLLDPHGGAQDLSRRRLRVLHDRSFVDDPTRLLRAARYAARLGLGLEPRTRRLAQEAVRAGCLDTVSGDRVRRELMLLLDDAHAAEGIRLCERLGVLRALHPSLSAGTAALAALRRAGELCRRFPSDSGTGKINCGLVGLLALAESLPTAAAGRALSERLRLTARQSRALRTYVEMRGRVRRRLGAPGLRSSVVARALEALPAEAVVALAATSGPRARGRCELFLARLRDMKSRLRGEDLKALGFAPGPAWSRALAAARAARLDGRAKSKEDELRIAAAVLRTHGRRQAGRR